MPPVEGGEGEKRKLSLHKPCSNKFPLKIPPNSASKYENDILIFQTKEFCFLFNACGKQSAVCLGEGEGGGGGVKRFVDLGAVFPV